LGGGLFGIIGGECRVRGKKKEKKYIKKEDSRETQETTETVRKKIKLRRKLYSQTRSKTSHQKPQGAYEAASINFVTRDNHSTKKKGGGEEKEHTVQFWDIGYEKEAQRLSKQRTIASSKMKETNQRISSEDKNPI